MSMRHGHHQHQHFDDPMMPGLLAAGVLFALAALLFYLQSLP